MSDDGQGFIVTSEGVGPAGNFLFPIPGNIHFDDDELMFCAWYEIYNSVPNISAALNNNIFYLLIDGTYSPILTLPDSKYTVDQLNGIIDSFVVLLGGVAGSIVLASANGAYNTLSIAYNYGIDLSYGNLNYILGFTADFYENLVPDTLAIYPSSNPGDINLGINSFSIRMPTLVNDVYGVGVNNGNDFSDIARGMLVPAIYTDAFTVGPNGEQVVPIVNRLPVRIKTKSGAQILVQITDGDGNILGFNQFLRDSYGNPVFDSHVNPFTMRLQTIKPYRISMQTLLKELSLAITAMSKTEIKNIGPGALLTQGKIKEK